MKKNLRPTSRRAAFGVRLLFLMLFFQSAWAQSVLQGTVSDAATKEPLLAVSLSLRGGRGTVTDAQGRFTVRVQPGEIITVTSVGYRAKQVVAPAGGQLDIALEAGETLLDNLVVVGSRGGARTTFNTPVPVDVLPIASLQRTLPQNDLNQLLTYVAPSFQSNRQSASDGTEHIDPASLRGLGPDQTLVLINGKRRHTTSLLNNQGTFGNGTVGTDLNAIPVSAIERVEVLRDGASAQYGSDAIAGVINVILKQNTGKLDIQATGGQFQAGDGRLLRLNANYGTRMGRYGGFINISAEGYTRGSTNRTQNHDLIIFDQSAQGNFFAYPFAQDPAQSRALDDAELQRRGLNRDDFNFHIGDARVNNLNSFVNLRLPFANGKTAFYAFGGYNYRRGRGFGFRRLPSETSNMVLSIFPNGYQPNTNSDIQDRSLAVGLTHQLGGWSLDLSNTFGNNRFDYSVNNTVNPSLGSLSPTSFRAGGHAFTQNTVNLDLTRYFGGVGQGLNVAFGGEYRYEQYRIRAGEEASYRNYALVDSAGTFTNPSGLAGGSQSFPGFAPDNAVMAHRSNVSLYVDTELDVTQRWTVTGAGRFEHYTDFGNAFTYKFSTRFKLTDALALRGAASTGFRAPSLHQQYFSYVSTTILNDGRLGESGFFRNNSALAQTLGIPKLRQETARNFSLGLTLNPTGSRLGLSVDAYRIRVQNRIVLTGLFGFDPFGTAIPALQQLFAPFGAAGGRFFTNGINTTTQGLDVVLTHSADLGKGRLNTVLAANFNRTRADDELNIPAALRGQEDVYFSPNERGLIETTNPRQKINLTLTYAAGPITVALANVYFGQVTRNGFPFGDVQTCGGRVVTDLSLTYNLLANLSLTVGANNLLNVYPDLQIYPNSYYGVFKYAPVQQGLNGAFYFGRAGWQLPHRATTEPVSR